MTTTQTTPSITKDEFVAGVQQLIADKKRNEIATGIIGAFRVEISYTCGAYGITVWGPTGYYNKRRDVLKNRVEAVAAEFYNDAISAETTVPAEASEAPTTQAPSDFTAFVADLIGRKVEGRRITEVRNGYRVEISTTGTGLYGIDLRGPQNSWTRRRDISKHNINRIAAELHAEIAEQLV